MPKRRSKKGNWFTPIRLEKDRTLMADDRTLLAYIRTALSIFIFGVVILKFFPNFPNIFIIFITSIILGLVILAIGIVEFLFFRKEANGL